MKRLAILITILIALGAQAFSQDTTPPEKVIYKGKMKGLQFEYFKNWKLDDNASALTLTPNEFSDYIEIHKEILKGTKEQLLEEIKNDGTTLEPTTFNGMDAYKGRYGYFIFFGKYYYTVGPRFSEKTKEQGEAILKSIKLK